MVRDCFGASIISRSLRDQRTVFQLEKCRVGRGTSLAILPENAYDRESFGGENGMHWGSQYPFFILAAIIIGGFGVLGWAVLRIYKKVKILFGNVPDSSGDAVHDVLQRIMRLEARTENMEPRLVAAEAIGAMSVQKVGFLRFNPFQDTGGDNSFIVVMLDSADNGFILSSLYMREGTRLYAKAVERGHAKQPLSDEEQKVLDDTISKN